MKSVWMSEREGGGDEKEAKGNARRRGWRQCRLFARVTVPSPGDSTTAETENSSVDTTYRRHGGLSHWPIGGTSPHLIG